MILPDSVIFPFMDGDIPRATSYGVFLIEFVLPENVIKLVTLIIEILTSKLIKQG